MVSQEVKASKLYAEIIERMKRTSPFAARIITEHVGNKTSKITELRARVRELEEQQEAQKPE